MQKRMAGRIEEHRPSLIGLRISQARAQFNGPFHRLGKLLVGREVEVHDRRARPDRRAVAGDPLRHEQEAR